MTSLTADVGRVFAEEIGGSTHQSEHARRFALQRYRVGLEMRAYLQERYGLPSSGTVLDVGCGNGGALFAFAAEGMSGVGIDTLFHPEFDRITRRTGIAARQVVGNGEHLSFADESFDLVLYLDTIEHVSSAPRIGAEIRRVLRPGGLCYITTPARLRFLFRPDPHYRIPGLLLLPDALQKRLFEKLRRGQPYEVTHTYWTSWGILSSLPGLRPIDITSSLTAGPLRRLVWDWIIARKE